MLGEIGACLRACNVERLRILCFRLPNLRLGYFTASCSLPSSGPKGGRICGDLAKESLRQLVVSLGLGFCVLLSLVGPLLPC